MTKVGSIFVSAWKPVCPRHITKPNNNFKDHIIVNNSFFDAKYSMLTGNRINWYRNELGKKPTVEITEYPRDLVLNSCNYTLYDMIGHKRFQRYLRLRTYMEALVDW